MHELRIVDYRTRFMPNFEIIDVTSKGPWAHIASPFKLGPVTLGGLTAQRMENLWQFTKVYPCHIDGNGDITPEWFEWSKHGLNSTYAQRRPLPRAGKPLFAFWEGERLDYIEARKRIYIPAYQQASLKTDLYDRLATKLETTNVALRDFDGYDYKKMGLSLDDVINNPRRIMGHAHVIALTLEQVMAS